MTDEELFTFLKTIVDEGLEQDEIEAELVQSFQPTGQGLTPEIEISCQIIAEKRYGWTHRKDVWNNDNGNFDHHETQQLETTFQMSCLALQKANDAQQLTAKDILQTVADTIQADSTLVSLKDEEMGILRITDIRNPQFKSDRNQWQASPNFDFTVTHKRSRIRTTPKISKFEVGVFPV